MSHLESAQAKPVRYTTKTYRNKCRVPYCDGGQIPVDVNNFDSDLTKDCANCDGRGYVEETITIAE
jgi:hypothetical protein